uniref:Uncharacterized protein n=2 Tax=Oryza TaxID=4527 RepID=A0A0E0Q7A7_ORYRU
MIDLEEEHNATNFKQNPIRYGNSERPQCGRRVKIVARKLSTAARGRRRSATVEGWFRFFHGIEPTVALPESVQPLNTDIAEKTNDFMSRVASCLNIKLGSQLINKAEKDSLTRSCNWGQFRVPTPYN